MGFYSLLTGELHTKKNKNSRLKNFTARYVGSFYWNLAVYGITADDSNRPPENVKKYILTTSDFAKGIQTDINHYVTRDRITNGSFRQKLGPISKNILRR